MGQRGPAPKLRAVREREGNPGKRPLPQGVRLPPEVPAEPTWAQVFPADPRGSSAVRLRKVAAAKWALWSRWLGSQGILSAIDDGALEAACVAFAEFREATRSGSTSEALKWLAAWTSIAGKIGLHPSSRDQLNPREGLHDPDAGWD